MEREPHQFKKSGRAHLLLGIVLMFLGLFLIADLADIIPWRMRDFIFTWQALLILLGIIFISNKESKGTGVILIAVGSFFLLPRFFELPHYWRSLFWPSMLILLGIVVIFGARRRGSCGRRTAFGSQSHASSDDYLDDVAVFGGGDRTVTSQQFQGGKITHIFGGSKYDFSRARLAPGDNNLELVLAFGGTKLIVPEEWNVKIEITSVFGGFSDKRVRSIVEKDREKTLIIRGINEFGGGEIVNYI
ncbi:MAG: cell wall-active antibiotics response protein [Bacteroidetes bacterium]|nr:cell wall-active antibiotics response protein [Bacteroidota bacterium]